jgi:hypothetical protein
MENNTWALSSLGESPSRQREGDLFYPRGDIKIKSSFYKANHAMKLGSFIDKMILVLI